MAVVISWEVFFGRRVREGIRAGGQVVLNPTNGSSYWLTQVQSQQVASSQLRALEGGREVVQVSPTGFSAFVDPDGDVSQTTDVSERAVIVADIDRLDGTTPAQALGDVPALALALGALAVVAATGRRARRADAPGRDASAEPVDAIGSPSGGRAGADRAKGAT
jgi:apolipoprotein N-acyltransferase